MHSQRSSQDASGALIPALILFGGLTLLLIGLLASRPTPIPTQTGEVTKEAVAVAAEATTAPQVVAVALDPAKVKAGENSFQTVCAACHGFNAMGIPGLGKPLIGSEFVNSQTDEELLAFLQVGRPITDPLNTTGVIMPARGGNPSLTDDKLGEVITYIRNLNQGQEAAAAPTTGAPTPAAVVATDVPTTFVPPDISGLAVPTTTGSDANTTNAQPVKTGEELYAQSCSGCHGADGSGVTYITGSLSDSTLLQNKDGIGLLNFLTKVEPPVSPLDHFQHPYRGGYPQLSDADLQSIIVYLYGLSTGQ